jgi:hypothetical protein
MTMTLSTEATELYSYADNDADLYRRRISPIRVNLSKKYVAGKYDHAKAKALWKYAADDAAKSYTKEYGTGSGFGIFTPAIRREVASEFADHWLYEMEAGNFESVTPKRLKNPAPRIGTARPRRVSQVTKKPPTKRLVKRRKQNTDVGYFPNPIKSARTEIVEEIRARVNHIASEKDIIRKQALVSYTEGVIHAANVCDVLTFNEALKYRALLKKYAA